MVPRFPWKRIGIDELAVLDSELELLELEVERAGTVPPLTTERVVVTVGAPPGGSVDGVAEALDRRIESTIETDVRVEVRLVTVDRA